MSDFMFEIETTQAHSNVMKMDIALLLEVSLNEVNTKIHALYNLVVFKDQQKVGFIPLHDLVSCTNNPEVAKLVKFLVQPSKSVFNDTRKYMTIYASIDNTAEVKVISMMGASDIKTAFNYRPLIKAKGNLDGKL